jgi:hypothetical protein
MMTASIVGSASTSLKSVVARPNPNFCRAFSADRLLVVATAASLTALLPLKWGQQHAAGVVAGADQPRLIQPSARALAGCARGVGSSRVIGVARSAV